MTAAKPQTEALPAANFAPIFGFGVPYSTPGMALL
jgi:hypothetical protein